MMTNLFSVFDPSTGMLSLNWISTMIGLILLPLYFWFLPSRFSFINMLIMQKLHLEFKLLMNKNSKGNSLLLISMFMFILFNNIMGLLPYVFTSSSHMVFTMSLALPLWMSYMIFGWMLNTNKMFYHLIPLGTPWILMPFMVCIETISNIIRPGSLAVRLTANMIAGHLLMSLLGNMLINKNFMMIIILLMIQMLLMMFEIAVSMIQAYVFSVLSTLYSSEI